MTEPKESAEAEVGPDSRTRRRFDPNDISPEFVHDTYGEEVLDVSSEDFEAMLAEHQTARGDVREGQIVKARVLRVTDATVILEFGFKSEGAVSVDEFKDSDGVEAGQEVEVLLESLEDDDGVVVLSKKKADFLRVWELIRDAYDNDRPVSGLLTRKIKGGVTVDIMGVDAFLPGSQIALRRVPNIEDRIGETYDFKIIKLNKRRRNIVVSRRVILEQERKAKRSTLVKELLKGQVRAGVVKNITDFGAFVDLGGLDGLLHITDMSWGRVGHPSEVVDIGATLDVKVLEVDWSRERISLGLKQLLPYPWNDIAERYPMGARVRGKVVSITNYGAFVELQEGVEGLVHISEMSWTRNVRHPSKLVSVGDEIEAVVLRVDQKEEKISLGMKQTEEDPWLALPVKYPVGTRLSGTVRNLTTYGAFIEIEPGIDGLVHVSDMSWTKHVEHPSEVVRKGEQVDVTILSIDADKKRVSLGVKQLVEDPWPELAVQFAAGVQHEGKVLRIRDKGVFVDLGDAEGFVPAARTGVESGTLDEYFQVGDSIAVRVVASDAGDRRIDLEALETPERRRTAEPADEDSDEESGEDSGEDDADSADEGSGDDEEAPPSDESGAEEAAPQSEDSQAAEVAPAESGPPGDGADGDAEADAPESGEADSEDMNEPAPGDASEPSAEAAEAGDAPDPAASDGEPESASADAASSSNGDAAGPKADAPDEEAREDGPPGGAGSDEQNA